MKKIIVSLLIIGMLLSLVNVGFGKINSHNNLIDPYDVLWAREYYGGEGMVEANGVAVDSGDNIIVTGTSNDNYYTIKYDSFGTEIWNRTYDGGYDNYAQSVAIDSMDNIIVTGTSNYDFHTIKYDPNGNEIWNKTWDGGYVDFAFGVAVDHYDNIIVTGRSSSVIGYMTYFEICTIKYNPNGDLLWVERTHYFCEGDATIYASDVAIDSTNNIIITGCSFNHTEGYNILTIKYDSAGNELWNKTFDKGWNDYGFGVAVDSQDNIIVTGTVPGELTPDFYTIKYTADGQEIWNATRSIGVGRDVTVDSEGNIIVTGYTLLSPDTWNFDYYSIVYSPSGEMLWDGVYLDSGGMDFSYGVATDSENNFIITGAYNGQYYCTVKYGNANRHPDTPDINGPTSGKPGVTYLYTFVTTDPDSDDVCYYVDWGDGTNSGWIGPYGSGNVVTVNHAWSEKGTYTIRVRARDIFGAESDWATLPVTMPMNQPGSQQSNPSPQNQQNSQPSSQPSTNQQSITSTTTTTSTPATTATTTTSTAPTSKSTSLPTSR